jgi:hypothetical protein
VNHHGSLATLRLLRPLLPAKVRLIMPARIAEQRVARER